MTVYRGRYEALALVARGGQGELWRGRDRVHGRDVALKIRRVPAGERDRILSEARTLLGMRPHPGLPVMRDDFFHGQHYVMVMDWIEGTPLDQVPEMLFEDVLARLGEVAQALDHLHAHDPPIVHRDVKPANVILTPAGRAVLVDLGLAGEAGHYGGTRAFVAPEVVRGENTTAASDVYGLAVTAYVLLTGSMPEPGREPDRSRVPSALRDQIRAALGEALAIDPRLRPHSASGLVSSLSPPHAPNNLPAQLTSFVGREVAGAEVRRRLQQTRLLTLCGPGGCGKTRLALRVAQSALPSFTGVWLAELEGVADPAFVPDAVSHALGVASERGREVVETLTSFLGTGSQLLVLDNCEHLPDACAHLCERLLRACAELRILATSREPLRASGEDVWMVPSMDPDESVRLFEARASLVEEHDAELVATICKRLDGIPLAIELAAARSVRTDLAELDQRLDEALGVLTGGVRTVPRHETLRATIDWSYELLSTEERTALCRLSVFASGFTRDAAREVCGAGDELDRLASASLLSRTGERLRMLETIRQYAAEKLGADQNLAARHARWYADFTERAAHELTGASQGEWLERLEAEHDNLHAALVHAVAEEPDTAARIASAAFRYWLARGHWNEGREWLDRTVTASGGCESGPRVDLLMAAGEMARFQGEFRAARVIIERVLALSVRSGDRSTMARCLSSLAGIAYEHRDFDSARTLNEESIAIRRELGDGRGLATSLNNLGLVLSELGEYEQADSILEEGLAIQRERADLRGLAATLGSVARNHFQAGSNEAARSRWREALAIATELGDEGGRGAILSNLGTVDLIEGYVGSARELFVESLEILRQLGFKGGVASSLEGLGEVARIEGDLDRAAAFHMEALALHREAQDPLGIAALLERLAAVDVASGEPVRAARRLGQADTLRERIGAPVPAFLRAELERVIDRARDALGAEVFEREWERGRRSAEA